MSRRVATGVIGICLVAAQLDRPHWQQYIAPHNNVKRDFAMQKSNHFSLISLTF
jgi:hypothetical protein